jgi:hypothetical protein
MEPLERLSKCILQPGEWIVVCCPAGNHNIVIIVPRVPRSDRPQRFLQSAANPVPDDGIADLAGDGEAEPRPESLDACIGGPGRLTLPRFHDEQWPGPARATTNPLELRRALQSFNSHDAPTSSAPPAPADSGAIVAAAR